MIEYFSTQNLIEKLVTTKVVPGVNYAFFKQDQTFNSTVGFSTWIPENIQLSPFAQYDLASLTKVLGTTNVFLKLKEDDKISFDQTVHEFLPEFANEQVTIADLLTHSSGIKGFIENRDELDADQLRDAIIHLPVTDDFRRVVKYSDTNLIILGFILEAIFEVPVWQVIEEQILEPLNLRATTFYPNPEWSIPTTIQPDGSLLQGKVHDPKAQVLQEHCGSAGLFSNIYDLSIIARAYLGLEPGFLPIKEETLNDLFEMKTTGQLKPRSWGWDLKFDPKDQHPLIYHTGFTGTFMLLDRQNQSGMIVLTNRIHPSGHNQIFLTAREAIVREFMKEND